ncbi:chromate transporter [Beijerinckia sp. L45]|uniref:chromate transporter n=1 Tax=Beijerinckia sp. L45 TaxID=1641855 RepID=UPI001FEEB371|nr:chromate transporter [Beijerinckia sp. L45]
METASPIPIASPVSRLTLFVTFLKIGVLGFGGVAAWVRHVVLVERGWMTEREFAELFGVASTLPGANTINFAAMLGDRYAGLSGAAAALAGLIGAPLVLLVVVATLYAHYAELQDVRGGLAGAAAAAAGLVLGTAFKLLRGLRPDLVMLLVVVGVFAAAALLQAPILVIIGIAIPLCIGTVVLRNRRRG